MLKLIIRRLLLWLTSWAQLIDGLLGVITLGYLRSRLTLKVAKVYSRYVFKHKLI